MTLSTVVDKKHHTVAQSVDLVAIARVERFSPPGVELGPGASGAGISELQANIVANNAGRSLCRSIGKYVVIDDSGNADGSIRLVVTGIVPTGKSSAGASSVIGFFSPVPFRLPVGLGALTGEAEMLGPDQSQIAVMRWSRGANSVTNGAKVSSIGDAWQLADRFGEEFAHAVMDGDPIRSGVQHAEVSSAVRKSNQGICDARFGKVSVAGKGASLFLPLSPESMDAGAPQRGNPQP